MRVPPQGGHYQVTITSKAFEGKKLLEAHRMIYQALEPVKSSIHALAIKVIGNTVIKPWLGGVGVAADFPEAKLIMV